MKSKSKRRTKPLLLSGERIFINTGGETVIHAH